MKLTTSRDVPTPPLNSHICCGLEFVCLSKMDASTVDRNGYAKVPVR